MIATDVLPMNGLTGVEFVQGDFSEEPVLARIVALVAGGQVDTVLSNMAPNMSGVGCDRPLVVPVSGELAVDRAERVLKRDGCALIKLFQGAGFRVRVGASRRKFCPGQGVETGKLAGPEPWVVFAG